MRRRPASLLLVLAAVAVAAGCGSSSSSSSGGGTVATRTTVAPSPPAASTSAAPATTPATPSGTVVVLAAASLTESFKALGQAFAAKYPGTSVTFSFGASSTLATQIAQGAPADVFASADAANMTKLTDASLVAGKPAVFATNALEIIVGKGNPKGIKTVADLASPSVTVVTCAPEVPIGKYTAQVFQKAGVTVTPKSYETDVKGIVNKVTLGEADAGVVYATDVKAAGDKAQGVPIPPDQNVVASYPIAALQEAKNPAGAASFAAFATSPQARAILTGFGFSTP